MKLTAGTLCPCVSWQSGDKVAFKPAGWRKVSAVGEDYGLLYCNFCPAHAHSFCGAGCSKWAGIIKSRQINRAQAKAGGAARQQKRRQDWEQATEARGSASFM